MLDKILIPQQVKGLLQASHVRDGSVIISHLIVDHVGQQSADPQEEGITMAVLKKTKIIRKERAQPCVSKAEGASETVVNTRANQKPIQQWMAVVISGRNEKIKRVCTYV